MNDFFKNNQCRLIRAKIILFLIFVFCFYAGGAHAVTLSITEVNKLGFGTLEKPSSGSHTFTVAPNGSTSGTGSLLSGIPAAGNYTLNCTAACGGSWTITIDIQSISSGNANLTIGTFKGDYAGGTAIASFPRSGLAKCNTAKTLLLGATATYNSSIPTTSFTPSYNIVVTTP